MAALTQLNLFDTNMAEPTNGQEQGTKKRRRDKKVAATQPGSPKPQRPPQRNAENRSPIGKYIFTYNGGGTTIVKLKEKWGDRLKLQKATANMEGDLTANGRASHAHRGVKHGKTLTIYPDKPVLKNNRYVFPDQFQIQVPSNANYNDVTNFLNSHAAEIWAFKWGSTTSYYYKTAVAATGGG
jgi:hypothetical protein